MHARFADCDPASDEDQIKTQTLESRIGEFKQNPHNMAILNAMLDEVVNCAEREANRLAVEQQKSSSSSSSQQGKEKRPSFAIPDFKNGKVVNRARGFVVRIFDAICNCANNNAAAATTRFKLRSNTGGGTGGGASGGIGNGEREREPETLALTKKKSSSADGKKKSKGVSMADDVEAGVRLVD
ncbi:uncharacterized protein Dwil_GK19166 [Drosophila willistoni]|uniref:Uncharacterized protein n=1 Tax=Drosophila willistoni TaxID=7260 RepID=B4MXM2_DROWI|nr:uncharacterized protein LOC6643055 isoform X1 [Drosophila willistoni]EDW76791.2 uncharacterized protein Dwil_GK19166 [Drosophila willistoni]